MGPSIHISKRDGCIRTRRKLDVQPPLHQIPAYDSKTRTWNKKVQERAEEVKNTIKNACMTNSELKIILY